MSEEKVRSLSYFAEDGSYGGASGLLVLETTHWSELDWQLIDMARDEARPTVARILTESYEPGANQELLRKKLEEDYGFDFSEHE
jgi:hypothetical protein